MNMSVLPFEKMQVIDGQLKQGRGEQEIDVVDPATSEVIARFKAASTEDLNEALVASEQGFETWKRITASGRQKILARAAVLIEERLEDIAVVMTMEAGGSECRQCLLLPIKAQKFGDLSLFNM